MKATIAVVVAVAVVQLVLVCVFPSVAMGARATPHSCPDTMCGVLPGPGDDLHWRPDAIVRGTVVDLDEEFVTIATTGASDFFRNRTTMYGLRLRVHRARERCGGCSPKVLPLDVEGRYLFFLDRRLYLDGRPGDRSWIVAWAVPIDRGDLCVDRTGPVVDPKDGHCLCFDRTEPVVDPKDGSCRQSLPVRGFLAAMARFDICFPLAYDDKKGWFPAPSPCPADELINYGRTSFYHARLAERVLKVLEEDLARARAEIQVLAPKPGAARPVAPKPGESEADVPPRPAPVSASPPPP